MLGFLGAPNYAGPSWRISLHEEVPLVSLELPEWSRNMLALMIRNPSLSPRNLGLRWKGQVLEVRSFSPSSHLKTDSLLSPQVYGNRVLPLCPPPQIHLILLASLFQYNTRNTTYETKAVMFHKTNGRLFSDS